MQSTMTVEEADPHDIFVIEPDVVLAARADTTPVPPVREAGTPGSAPKIHPLLAEVSGIVAGPSVPPVDTTFRATDVNAAAVDAGKIQATSPGEIPSQVIPSQVIPSQVIPSQVSDQFTATKPSRGRWAARTLIGFLFAVCSATAAATWQHYGDTAKQKVAAWIPNLLHASSTPVKAAAAEPPAAPATESSAADQGTATNQAASLPAPSAPAVGGAVAPATATAAESSQVQAMARDMAAMGQQIEQLKASIAQLQAGQEKMSQQMSHDLVKNTVARLADPAAHARIAPRPMHKPKPVYTPVLATPAPVVPPPHAAIAPLPPPPDLQTQAASDPGGDPVVRPPMPLR